MRFSLPCILATLTPGRAAPRDTSNAKPGPHDAAAPWWAAGLLVLGAAGLSTIWFDPGTFWRGYVLDMAGPAWNYILFRGLYTAEADNAWTRFFTPWRTLLSFVVFCYGVEGAQYFGLYDATFDPWDFLAYVSILVPLFTLDLMVSRRRVARRP